MFDFGFAQARYQAAGGFRGWIVWLRDGTKVFTAEEERESRGRSWLDRWIGVLLVAAFVIGLLAVQCFAQVTHQGGSNGKDCDGLGERRVLLDRVSGVLRDGDLEPATRVPARKQRLRHDRGTG